MPQRRKEILDKLRELENDLPLLVVMVVRGIFHTLLQSNPPKKLFSVPRRQLSARRRPGRSCRSSCN
jgi:hypothetical protein